MLQALFWDLPNARTTKSREGQTSILTGQSLHSRSSPKALPRRDHVEHELGLGLRSDLFRTDRLLIGRRSIFKICEAFLAVSDGR